MKKVLHLLQSSKFSGAEKVACEIIGLFDEEIEMAYCSPNGSIVNVIKEKEIRYLELQEVNVKSLKRVICEYKPDIIHSHDFTMSILAALCSKVPIISHLHHNPNWIKKINIKSLTYCIAAYRFTKIVTVSKAISQEYIFGKLIDKKLIVMPNPVALNNIYKGITDSEVNKKDIDLLFVGRLVEVKDPIKFIEIVEKLKRNNNNIVAKMLGEGPLYEECEKKIRELDLNNNIELVGFRKDVYQYMQRSKLLLIPSKWEGFGLVATEAMALRVPVIAQNVGGLKEIINDKSGKLCNSIEDYIQEISLLMQDEKYYNYKSQEAFNRAKELENIDEYKKKIKEIYSI